jgi:hypothetical protein
MRPRLGRGPEIAPIVEPAQLLEAVVIGLARQTVVRSLLIARQIGDALAQGTPE